MHRSIYGWVALQMVATLALGGQTSALASPPRPSCSGALLQFSVVEQGKTAVDRFRFALALSGEGRTEAAESALSQLRRDLLPLIQGTLTVPAPRTHHWGEIGQCGIQVVCR